MMQFRQWWRRLSSLPQHVSQKGFAQFKHLRGGRGTKET
jgi:hypothetical protein